MSARNVARTFLTCDTCGKERSALAADATMARIEAAADGWKFIKYDRWAHGNRKGTPRTWDACETCEVPATPEAAQEIRQSREETR
ncbi:MAG TPA: hypothetical protein VIR33_05500 [Thermopolyspora sp.]|jgi:hypothetical protein